MIDLASYTGRIFLKGTNETDIPGMWCTDDVEEVTEFFRKKDVLCWFLLVDCIAKKGDTVKFMEDLLQIIKDDSTRVLESFTIVVCTGEKEVEDLTLVEWDTLNELRTLREQCFEAFQSRYSPGNLRFVK